MTEQETLDRARQYLAMPNRVHHHPPRIGDSLISDLLSLVEKQRRETLEECETLCNAKAEQHVAIAEER